jgi:NDP-sugar pyrophosphorylase family protein
MSVVVSMAGLGSRFSKVGYKQPKYKILVKGRTLFEWSMLSMKDFFDDHFVFACLEDADIEWIRKAAKDLGILSCSFHIRESVSRGQAETVYDAVSLLRSNDVLWVYNIDTYVENGMEKTDIENAEGCLHVSYSKEPNMSFVDYDINDNVSKVVEKEQISTWASVGSYGFSSVELFEKIYEKSYLSKMTEEVGGERYIAPMYSVMLSLGMRVVAPKLDQNLVHVLGTPEDLLKFDE